MESKSGCFACSSVFLGLEGKTELVEPGFAVSVVSVVGYAD